eukprot:EG_transcript_5443
MGGGGKGKGAYYKQLYGGRRAAPAPTEAPAEDGPTKGDDGEEDAGPDVSDWNQGTAAQLKERLQWIDGKQYGAYKDIAGTYHFPDFTLFMDSIQRDPFAPPSRMRVRVPWAQAGVPSPLVANRIRRVATGDFLTRTFWSRAHEAGLDEALAGGSWAAPKGGDVNISKPSQHVLQRTSVVIVPLQFVEARCTIGLPAAGRRILADRAAEVLCRKLPRVVAASLLYSALDAAALEAHVLSVEDQDALRRQLAREGLAAFVRDGAVLPRASGASDLPMPADAAVPFASPPTLQRTLPLPNRGAVSGMAIPRGVTLIVGGGFNGKSTLLEALAVGMYDHVPGDGREFVCIDPTAVQIQAEDGRRASGVDISPFISHLPGGRSVTQFTTEDASGSTSQATNIVEALEAGCRTLLLDEDTCATNFMIRDERMQRLVAKEKEPITPFLQRVKGLHTQEGVSTILVMGGSGDYFEVADHVIMMADFHAVDVTTQAKAVAAQLPARTVDVVRSVPCCPTHPRVPCPASLWPLVNAKVRAHDVDGIRFGGTELELRHTVHLVEKQQTHAIADAVVYLGGKLVDGRRSLVDLLDVLEAQFDDDKAGDGLDVLRGGQRWGHFARPRRQEIAAALNRLRGLVFRVGRP